MDDEYEKAFDRAHLHALAYRDKVDERPPFSELDFAQARAAFDGPTPEAGLPGPGAIDALAEAAEPGLMTVSSPRFFGWVMGGSHPVGVAADWLTSAWGQNAGNLHISPASAAAEAVAGKWLLDLLDLPRDCSVGFVSGCTIANFVGLAAARSKVLADVGWDVEADGLQGAPKVTVFIGDDGHTTVFQGLSFLGLGSNQAVRIATDNQGRMIASDLATAMAQHEGPKIVIAQAGQINTGAFDPFEDIARLTKQHGAWLHVDSAFGLWSRICPEMADLTRGIELADSWATDGHKWLQVPYDSGFVFVRDAAAHARAMTIAASYLPTVTSEERDPSHFVPELSRRARGFALWALIRNLGRAGIQEMVRRHCTAAQMLAKKLSVEPGIEILNDVVLNQVAIGFGAGCTASEQDALAHQVIDRLRALNRFALGGAQWKGRWILRCSIITGTTQLEHVEEFGDAIIAAWHNVNR